MKQYFEIQKEKIIIIITNPPCIMGLVAFIAATKVKHSKKGGEIIKEQENIKRNIINS
jgi:hypothetical protein